MSDVQVLAITAYLNNHKKGNTSRITLDFLFVLLEFQAHPISQKLAFSSTTVAFSRVYRLHDYRL